MIIDKKMRLIPDFYAVSDTPNSEVKEGQLQEVPNGYLEVLEIQDALETSRDDQIIEMVCSKIQSGGRLIMSGVDGHSLAMGVAHGSKRLDEFGHYIKVANRLNSLSGLSEYFMLRKWKVVSAFAGHESYNLEVEKP
jgi:hypothetical protein